MNIYYKVLYIIKWIMQRRHDMVTANDKQIDQLIEDISSIKSCINKNKSVLRQILLPAHFRLLSLILGISIIIFSMFFHYFINRYGSYGLIPGYIKGILFGAIVVDWVFLVILKYSNWLKSILEIDYRYTFGDRKSVVRERV